jgi:hypothetical protein
MSPWERASPIVPDDRLGARGNPYHPEHDVAGHRNRIRPGQADIVVLGDSNAYGGGIVELWPARLGAYKMALPSYGPGQDLLQLEEALAFNLADATLADAICDRILHNAHRLVLKDPHEGRRPSSRDDDAQRRCAPITIRRSA